MRKTLACAAAAVLCWLALGPRGTAPARPGAAPKSAGIAKEAPAAPRPPAAGQGGDRYVPTPAEVEESYRRAQQLGGRLAGRVYKAKVTPHWFDNNTRFWYRNDLRGGKKEFILVDAAQGGRGPAFDHKRLAAALSRAAGATYSAEKLPFDAIEFADGGKAVRFSAAGSAWRCDLTSYEVARAGKAARAEEVPPPAETVGDEEPADEDDESPQQKKGGKKGPPRPPFGRELASPDGKWTAIVREYNVVLRDKDGNETVLTKEGTASVPFGGFAWAPDSKALVAYRNEPGDNKEVYTIETSPRDQLAAKLHTRVYPRPGDKLPTYEMWVIDVAAKKAHKADVEKIDYGPPPRPRWKSGGTHFTFEKADRGHQRFRLVEVAAQTGATRNIIDEKTDTFIWTAHRPRLGLPGIDVTYFDRTDEILLVSQRDGWKHLYLIDAKEGKVKNQITKGEWVVRAIDRVDEAKRQIWFRASGKNAGQDPYLVHYYRINFDGTELVALTEGDGNHTIEYSPDRQYLIDTYSSLDRPPVTELRRVSDGKLVCKLEEADVSALTETGWRAPEVFSAKGRDGKTDVWGVVYRPQKFDPKKKYPVIEYIYAGPHDSHVPKSFASYRNLMALAELGFIVVQIDGMGTASRSKAFHDVCWKNLGDAGFPDRVLWIKSLATRYPYVDATRVGIFGTSAGGQNALGALLFHGYFYQAAVAACGCHDNRLDKFSWNEQWMGLMGPHYAKQSNVTNAGKLTGKLLLIVGELDTNVPPESTMRVADALIKARKHFDLLVVPGMGHSNGGPYGEARLRDFFVRHLHGVEPPDRNRPAAAAE